MTRTDNINTSNYNNISCIACFKYWSCKKSEKSLNRGCDTFLSIVDAQNQPNLFVTSNQNTTPSSELSQTGKKEAPSKSLSSAFEKLLKDDYIEEADYSSYFNPEAYGLQLPEDDFPLAKNLYEFVFSRKFLNLGTTGLYARQFGIGLNLFMEYCPKCSDVAYVNKNFEVKDSLDNILERVVLFEHGVCPKCKTRKDDLIQSKVYWEHFELAALCGQRSGKSLMAAIFACYVLHRFLKLPQIATAYDIAKPTILLGTFVAIDKSQIQDSTWGYLTNLIKGSPWFITYCAMLRDYGRKLGRRLVDIEKVETLEFFHKNLKLNMAAPKPAALRGRTGFLGVVDEIGFLKTKDGQGRVITAEEVYAALNNRMATLTTAYENQRGIVPNLPAPLFMNISSPSHVKDKICSLVKTIQEQNLEAACDDSGDTRMLRRYAVHYATWEVNPMFSKDSAYIVSKFKSEPKEAERDFGAKPPLSENSFIDNINLLMESSNEDRKNLVSLDYEFGTKDTKYKVLYNNPLLDKTVSRVLALDLGYNNNSTALAIGYYDALTNRTIIEALIEIIPTKTAEIKFTQLVAQVIKPLIESLNIKIVASDQWQSISLSQDIEETTEAKALTYSLKYGDFLFYKSDLLSQKIEYPGVEDLSLITPKALEEYPYIYYNKPVTHFVYQCLTVVDEKDKAIRKGEKTTDDLFRASVLLHYILNNFELRKQMSATPKQVLQGAVVHVQSMKNGQLGGQNSSTKYSSANVVVV